VFRSTEPRDLVEWMCAWNQEHPTDPVHTYNFDIQRQALPAADALIAFLHRLDFTDDDPDIQGILACDGVVDTFFPSLPFPAERFEQCGGALDHVWSWLADNEHEAIHRTSRVDLAWARIQVVIEQSWQRQIFYLSDFPRAFVSRDAGMAYLATAIRELRFPHERVMLWAHNGHLIRGTEAYNGVAGGMGDHLGAELGRDYVVVVQVAHETSTDWPAVGLCGVVDFLIEPSIEGRLYELGEPFLLLDLDPRGSHPSLLDPEALYSIGGSDPLIPRDHQDAVLYLEVSPSMNPLAWSPCQ
jgi:Erythromycin esterase